MISRISEFSYRTVSKSWSRLRCLVAKAEQIADKENPRERQVLYEKLYCACGEMENRIKDQMSLFADGMSTESFRGNQLRLCPSTFAYTLLRGLREHVLQGTELAKAQPQNYACGYSRLPPACA